MASKPVIIAPRNNRGDERMRWSSRLISQRQLDMTDLLLKFLPVDFITDVSKNYIINLV